MDLPLSGWYPDPYGTPGLLRWWDGTTWTEHTYAETRPQTPDQAVRETAPQAEVAPTTVQPAVTTVQPAVTSVQPAVTTVQPAVTSVQSPVTSVRDMRPPTGPRTSPQPAIPLGEAGDGTRVLYLDQGSGGMGSGGMGSGGMGSGGFDGPKPGSRRRRRRIIIATGVAGGVVVAIAVIALVVSMGQSPAAPVAEQSATAPATAAASSAPTAAPSPSPSAPTASPTQATLSTVSDATSGLSYGQLPAPWSPGCPGGLNGQAFSWTAGESAVAGPLPNGETNNGQPDWFGAACSGPLPAQYGYNGTADLENVTTNLANTFNGTYYDALPHNFQAVESQPVSVSGHPGWEVKFLLTYTNPQGLAWTNEMGAVVVADPGTGAAPAVFYVSVPGNLNEDNVDTLVSSLQLTALPPPQPTAPPTTPPTAPPSTPAVPAGSPAVGG
jgi:Protein of unknown function (DUF2510)/Ubiquitinol-cytochrome C reductase Fe-S subunit TAT signal